MLCGDMSSERNQITLTFIVQKTDLVTIQSFRLTGVASNSLLPRGDFYLSLAVLRPLPRRGEFSPHPSTFTTYQYHLTISLYPGSIVSEQKIPPDLYILGNIDRGKVAVTSHNLKIWSYGYCTVLLALLKRGNGWMRTVSPSPRRPHLYADGMFETRGYAVVLEHCENRTDGRKIKKDWFLYWMCLELNANISIFKYIARDFLKIFPSQIVKVIIKLYY